jgi:hypothetical protein
MDDGQVVARRFLVAGGDAAERLERVEEDLDEISVAIQLLVVATNAPPGGIRRDDIFHATGADGATDMASIIAGVGDTGLACGLRNERPSDRGFMLLAGRQLDVERATFEIYDRVELGRKASTRASQSIASQPPFPPAASWWARAIVASSKLPRLSTRKRRALKMRSKRPARDQLAKRL